MENIWQIILSSLIIFVASLVQGAVGFGFSLIAVPVLAIFLPMTRVVPIIVMCSLITNIMVIISTKKHIKISDIWLMILMGILGIPLGVYGLKYLNPDILKGIVGLLICITAIIMLKGYKINLKNKYISYGLTGFISGILNGSLSMSGPPIVLLLNNDGCHKNTFKGNLAAYFMVANIITIIIFGLSGLLSYEVIKHTSINILPLLLGTFLGILISKKIKEKVFSQLVLFLLIIIGLSTLIKVKF